MHLVINVYISHSLNLSRDCPDNGLISDKKICFIDVIQPKFFCSVAHSSLTSRIIMLKA